MNRLLTLENISSICHLSERTLLHWIQKGILEAVKNPEGVYLVPLSSLIRTLQNLRLCIPDELGLKDSLKVLIVDDEPGIRRLIRLNLLLKFPGILIEESQGGFHAGWRAHDFIPDILILDLLMPGIDGFRLCHLVKNAPESAATKIIAISALKERETKDKILQMGADEFIAKPFHTNTLIAAIEKMFPDKLKVSGSV